MTKSAQMVHLPGLLKERAAVGRATRVLQIGANDGQTSDPVYPFLQAYDWPSLLVEPVELYFRALARAYARRPLVRLANVAITQHTGTCTLFRVAETAIEAGHVPAWARGASSLHPDRTALHWADISPHVQELEVPCLDLAGLLDRYRWSRFDVLQIDAEGHDFQILKQVEFTKHRPDIINIEWVNLPANEQRACLELFEIHGYSSRKTGYDRVAWIEERRWQFAS